MSFIKTIINIREYLTTGIWHLRIKDLSPLRALSVRALRITALAFRGYREDRCPLRASALTFYSLLSIVPVAAMLFGIAKGFGYQKTLEAQLLEQFAEHEAVITKAVEFSQSMLESTKGGLIAGIGVLLLFWTVIRVLGNIEYSFNDIWKVRVGRNVLRKFTDYLAIMLIAPVNFIISSSATLLITSQMVNLGESLGLSSVTAPILSIILRIIPWLLIWALFSFVYIVMPNTRVKWKSGIIAAVIAGTAFQVIQILFVKFQLGVAGYNAIYGGFAALPLFLVWLQLSWMIVLLGAEISFAVQNADSYEYAPLLNNLSVARKRLMTVYVAYFGVNAFAKGNGPTTAADIAAKLEIPIVIVRDAIADLLKAELFTQTVTERAREATYQPSIDIQRFTIAFVLKRLDHAGSDELPAKSSKELISLSDSLTTFEETLLKSPANKLLSDL